MTRILHTAVLVTRVTEEKRTYLEKNVLKGNVPCLKSFVMMLTLEGFKERVKSVYDH